jgi:hypothetical protein
MLSESREGSIVVADVLETEYGAPETSMVPGPRFPCQVVTGLSLVVLLLALDC